MVLFSLADLDAWLPTLHRRQRYADPDATEKELRREKHHLIRIYIREGRWDGPHIGLPNGRTRYFCRDLPSTWARTLTPVPSPANDDVVERSRS